jgi:predicted phosphoribosyltransferase
LLAFYIESGDNPRILKWHLSNVLERQERQKLWDEIPTVMVMEEMPTPRETHVLNPQAQAAGVSEAYLAEERQHQLAEIARRKKLFRAIRPHADITGRSVIVTDDGIATGSTMIAALQAVRAQRPHELIMAVPVAAPERFEQISPLCDEAVCLLLPDEFYAVGQFYEDFEATEDDEVVQLLRESLKLHPSGELP